MLLSLYSVFHFNPLYVTDQAFKDYTGYFMMSVIAAFIAVHFFFLAKTMLLDFIDKVKKCSHRYKSKSRARKVKTTDVS